MSRNHILLETLRLPHGVGRSESLYFGNGHKKSYFSQKSSVSFVSNATAIKHEVVISLDIIWIHPSEKAVSELLLNPAFSSEMFIQSENNRQVSAGK